MLLLGASALWVAPSQVSTHPVNGVFTISHVRKSRAITFTLSPENSICFEKLLFPVHNENTLVYFKILLLITLMWYFCQVTNTSVPTWSVSFLVSTRKVFGIIIEQVKNSPSCYPAQYTTVVQLNVLKVLFRENLRNLTAPQKSNGALKLHAVFATSEWFWLPKLLSQHLLSFPV